MEFLTFEFYDKLSDFTLYSSVAILYIYLFFKKKDRLLDFSVALILAIAASKVIKHLTGFDRPQGVLVFDDSSFPSMHTTLAYTVFFFYLVVCHKLTQGKGLAFKDFRGIKQAFLVIVLFILSFLTGILRYISTAHHLRDVIAGIILGLIISLAFRYYDINARRVK
jgi:membrane-associated phospholipid phosphatase